MQKLLYISSGTQIIVGLYSLLYYHIIHNHIQRNALWFEFLKAQNTHKNLLKTHLKPQEHNSLQPNSNVYFNSYEPDNAQP